MSSPRLGARVLAMDPDDRVLLLLSIDPLDPAHQWWDLPGGGAHPGEDLADTARRELAEETGHVVDALGPHLWDREVTFWFRGERRHRRDRVWLGRVPDTEPGRSPELSSNERANLIEARWWTPAELMDSSAKFLPPALPDLVGRLVGGTLKPPVFLDR